MCVNALSNTSDKLTTPYTVEQAIKRFTLKSSGIDNEAYSAQDAIDRAGSARPAEPRYESTEA